MKEILKKTNKADGAKAPAVGTSKAGNLGLAMTRINKMTKAEVAEWSRERDRTIKQGARRWSAQFGREPAEIKDVRAFLGRLPKRFAEDCLSHRLDSCMRAVEEARGTRRRPQEFEDLIFSGHDFGEAVTQGMRHKAAAALLKMTGVFRKFGCSGSTMSEAVEALVAFGIASEVHGDLEKMGNAGRSARNPWPGLTPELRRGLASAEASGRSDAYLLGVASLATGDDFIAGQVEAIRAWLGWSHARFLAATEAALDEALANESKLAKRAKAENRTQSRKGG